MSVELLTHFWTIQLHLEPRVLIGLSSLPFLFFTRCSRRHRKPRY